MQEAYRELQGILLDVEVRYKEFRRDVLGVLQGSLQGIEWGSITASIGLKGKIIVTAWIREGILRGTAWNAMERCKEIDMKLKENRKGCVGNCREFYIVHYSTVAHYNVSSADSFRVTAMLAK